MKIERLEDVYVVISEIQDEGDKWHHEKIHGPTIAVLQELVRIVGRLSDDLGLLPNRIAQSVREGVTARFELADGRMVLLEIYNDMSGAMMLLKNRKNVETFDLPKSKEKVEIVCQAMMKILQN